MQQSVRPTLILHHKIQQLMTYDTAAKIQVLTELLPVDWRAFYDAGGPGLMVGLLQDRNVVILKKTLSILQYFMQHNNARSFWKAGVIPPLVGLLSHPQAEIKAGTAELLSQLSTLNEGSETGERLDSGADVRIAGGIASLVKLLAEYDASVRGAAAKALSMLAFNAENRNEIRFFGGIGYLVNMARIDTPVQEVLFALQALKNLCYEVHGSMNINKDVIRTEGGIDCFVSLLSMGTDETKIAALEGLYAVLCNNEENQRYFKHLTCFPMVALETMRRREGFPRVQRMATSMINFCDSKTKTELVVSKKLASSVVDSLGAASFRHLSIKPVRVAHRQDCKSPPRLHPEPLPIPPASWLNANDLSDVQLIASADLNCDYGEELGTGGFGVVYKGTWQMIPVAIKQLHAKGLTEKKVLSFKNEALRHKCIAHPNIVRLYGVCIELRQYSMVMEFMAMGSLYDVLKTKPKFTEPKQVAMVRDIAVGLHVIHSHGMIHCDLKSPNVLVDSYGNPKISDFGLATEIKTGLEAHEALPSGRAKGSVRWMPPELLNGTSGWTIAADIFSLGVLIREILAEDFPYRTMLDEEVKNFVSQGGRESIPRGSSLKLAAVLTACWAQRAKDRLASAKAVVEALERPLGVVL